MNTGYNVDAAITAGKAVSQAWFGDVEDLLGDEKSPLEIQQKDTLEPVVETVQVVEQPPVSDEEMASIVSASDAVRAARSVRENEYGSTTHIFVEGEEILPKGDTAVVTDPPLADKVAELAQRNPSATATALGDALVNHSRGKRHQQQGK